MLTSSTNLFAIISAQGYQILDFFVLIDRSICQLTKMKVIASSGAHFFLSLLFILNVVIFVKLTPSMHN